MIDEQFEWDDRKALLNVRRHGITFDQAKNVFNDPLAMTQRDGEHSDGEEREVTLGDTWSGITLVVHHTRRGDKIRIISARRATAAELRKMANGNWICDKGEPGHDPLDHEIDFDPAKAVRGKYYRPHDKPTVYCRLDAELVDHFGTNDDINEALRTLIAQGYPPQRKRG
ncbi:MAG TPA: BrnT family toxin [Thermoanaerobaculia bacterium]